MEIIKGQKNPDTEPLASGRQGEVKKDPVAAAQPEKELPVTIEPQGGGHGQGGLRPAGPAPGLAQERPSGGGHGQGSLSAAGPAQGPKTARGYGACIGGCPPDHPP